MVDERPGPLDRPATTMTDPPRCQLAWLLDSDLTDEEYDELAEWLAQQEEDAGVPRRPHTNVPPNPYL